MATQIRGSVDIMDGTVTDAKIVTLAWSKITGTPTTLSGYGITSPLPAAQGGTATSTVFTAGSVVFAGASGVYSQDNATFFYDSTNHRLGLGINSSLSGATGAILTINGAAGTNALVEFAVNSSEIGHLRAFSNTVFQVSAEANRLELRTATDQDIRFLPNSGEVMRVRASGVSLTGSNPTAILHLKAGTATASTAPLKFNSGTLLTTAEAGAMEFTTDDLYFTITTGAARKGVVLNDGTNLTSGKIPKATTNGRLIDGQTPLSGTKVYYVSDTSGGAVTRKLTFIDGILTAET